eukprot:scaffold763_cov403-Pavlova_lutheri.AAC.8
MTRMEELKDELEALKVQLIQQGEELEKLRSNPSSSVQDGTSTQSITMPSIPRGPMETIVRPKGFSFHNMGEDALSEAFEAWWGSVTRWFGRRKARQPDLEESECVVDLLDMIQGPKCAVLDSLYEKGTLPQDLGAFKTLLIQLHRIRPSSEAAYKGTREGLPKAGHDGPPLPTPP